MIAPLDGVVSERLLHPGSLAGPGSGIIVRVDQVNRLHVVVAVPEANVFSIPSGQRAAFSVTGYPGESFSGVVRRISHTLERKSRTMSVQLELANFSGKLAPEMYTEVRWPDKSGHTTLLLPATAITSNTECSFVIRVEKSIAKYVNVRKGSAQGELVEVPGLLAVGDTVVERAPDEIREGTRIPAN